MESLFQFFRNLRARKRERLEKEYSDLCRIIDLCLKENEASLSQLQSGAVAAASADALIKDNNMTITILGVRQRRLARRLGYQEENEGGF